MASSYGVTLVANCAQKLCGIGITDTERQQRQITNIKNVPIAVNNYNFNCFQVKLEFNINISPGINLILIVGNLVSCFFLKNFFINIFFF